MFGNSEISQSVFDELSQRFLRDAKRRIAEKGNKRHNFFLFAVLIIKRQNGINFYFKFRTKRHRCISVQLPLRRVFGLLCNGGFEFDWTVERESCTKTRVPLYQHGVSRGLFVVSEDMTSGFGQRVSLLCLKFSAGNFDLWIKLRFGHLCPVWLVSILCVNKIKSLFSNYCCVKYGNNLVFDYLFLFPLETIWNFLSLCMSYIFLFFVPSNVIVCFTKI